MADDDDISSEFDNPQVIIHFDIDCFYAQVEMVRNPSLRDKPVGIKQKNFMVTCNYIARSLGVMKSMRIYDALKVLPDLVLVDGSDLTHYRHYSAEIFSILQTYTKSVEKLGMDENFMDVTDLLDDFSDENALVVGQIFSCNEDVDLHSECSCGCYTRLIKGSVIAKKIRDQIYDTLGLTTCAGIAHNKLLAKLVSGHKKPNNQTIIFPNQVQSIMRSLKSPKDIPGVGSVTYKILESMGLTSLELLQTCAVDLLNKKFDPAFSVRLKNFASGIDNSKVKPSGPPQTLSIEDAVKKISSFLEAKSKLEALTERLLILLREDGRFPRSLKLTIRRFCKDKPYGQRETRNTELPSSLFGKSETVAVTPKITEELNKITINLFTQMVNIKETFFLTLLGVGFTKFYERATNTQSIAQFFAKRLAVDEVATLNQELKSMDTTCEYIAKDSTVINIPSSSKQSRASLGLHSKTLFDTGIRNFLVKETKRDLQDPTGSKNSEFPSSCRVTLLEKSKIKPKLKSKLLKQNPVKQKKIDSFFIQEDNFEDYLPCSDKHSMHHKASIPSTSSEDSKRTETYRTELTDKIKLQLNRKGIDISIFEELPQDIKEEILSQL